MEEPNVPKALAALAPPELSLSARHTTYFASRESVRARPHQGMALWRDKLFVFLQRNATGATEFFSIPGNRLVELGTQVAI